MPPKKEGREEGLEKGQFVGKILTLQELMMLPVSDPNELKRKSLEELQKLAMELQQVLRSRSGVLPN